MSTSPAGRRRCESPARPPRQPPHRSHRAIRRPGADDGARTGLYQWALRVTDEGLLARFAMDPPEGMLSVALDRRPQDIALPAPATATAGDLAWLAGAWVGTSRTVRGGKMIAFEFLRVVERDGGWVYVAQPDGAPPTEFVLTEWGGTRAFRTLALVSVKSAEGHSEFDLIYVSGDSNLENLKAPDDTWKVRLIEEEFFRLMFESDGV